MQLPPQELFDVPQFFYKYRALSTDRDIARLKEIVIGNNLYFSSPKDFNDPFDCRPAFNFSGPKERFKSDYIRLIKKFDPQLNRQQRREDARAMMKDSSRNPRNQTVQHTIQDHYNEEMNKIGVFCVSEVRDDILMWSHYAASHSGICLEFDGLGKLMAHAQKIIYAKHRPSIPQFERADPTEMLDRGLLTKSTHWSYEKEWRLIRYKKGFGQLNLSQRILLALYLEH